MDLRGSAPLFRVLTMVLVFSGTGVSRAVLADETCFDFGSRVTQSLMEPIPRMEKKDAAASGKLQSKGVWGAARGAVERPIEELLSQLLDPFSIKDPEKAQVEVSKASRPGYFAFQHTKVTVKPFLFLTVEWEEDWGFVVAEGNEKNPKRIVISFQKTAGTSHIEKLCGSIVLRKLKPSLTDVFLYEEIISSHRSEEDTVRGHLITLQTLRKKKPTAQ